jgi:hypothetical protein
MEIHVSLLYSEIFITKIFSALMFATVYTQPESIKLLIERNADAKHQNKIGMNGISFGFPN